MLFAGKTISAYTVSHKYAHMEVHNLIFNIFMTNTVLFHDRPHRLARLFLKCCLKSLNIFPVLLQNVSFWIKMVDC